MIKKITEKQIRYVAILMNTAFGKDRKKVLETFWVDSTKKLDSGTAGFLIKKLSPMYIWGELVSERDESFVKQKKEEIEEVTEEDLPF